MMRIPRNRETQERRFSGRIASTTAQAVTFTGKAGHAAGMRPLDNRDIAGHPSTVVAAVAPIRS